FSLQKTDKNNPWKLWVLAADSYIPDRKGGITLGIMFDVENRGGCAIFHENDYLSGSDAVSQREQLHTYVHEVGHAFNFLHSFDKNRSNSLSWMNYPDEYANGRQKGETHFWRNFTFSFDWEELFHLRHAFRDHIIMGGEAWGEKHAAKVLPRSIPDLIDEWSGLDLEIRSKQNYKFGEPVVLEIKLASNSPAGVRTHTELHPKSAFVSIFIKGPDGSIKLFQPLGDRLVKPKYVDLYPGAVANYEGAYIGFGKDGFYFEQPGNYQIRAVYRGDGATVVSAPISIRVRSPISKEDEDAAELLMGGTAQGELLVTLGSDSPSLESGNKAMDMLISEYQDNVLSDYARLVKANNASRNFKQLNFATRKVEVREAKADQVIELLPKAAENAANQNRSFDNLTLNLSVNILGKAYKDIGDADRAKNAGKSMLGVFEKRGIRKEILDSIADEFYKNIADGI
ncbi:MAG: hypothetical protein K2X29_04715, partial [Candidatus Obscuribacterales bacterium]|nr:hypothetical protein [Candidatus Obscuribacterales bacterium]